MGHIKIHGDDNNGTGLATARAFKTVAKSSRESGKSELAQEIAELKERIVGLVCEVQSLKDNIIGSAGGIAHALECGEISVLSDIVKNLLKTAQEK